MRNSYNEKFNEATRVQMPALVHLTRLGYQYFGKVTEDMAGSMYDPDTNILVPVFLEQFKKLNPGQEGKAEETLRLIRQELDDDDLGRGFYKRLTAVSPVRLVDFEHPENNIYHCTAEFTCKRDQDEFRPDITLFVNGLPLVFVEVKKPNNQGGIVAESERMNRVRFPNKKFRRFINITQFMIFSNNMEYDADGGIVPIQGAFYCTAARDKAPFNCFREENPANSDIAPFNRLYPYLPVNPEVERKILADFNCQVIHNAPEYQTNKSEHTPTNRVLTSMCSPDRLLFILKYGIAYVKMEREVDGKIESTDQKHIMRYQQMFAALAIRRKLGEGVTSGVVWHTQGSGKTALSYYLTNVLTDYYAKQNKVARYYFIVDRLDLLEQASQEFEARGLVVKTANSRDELMKQFRVTQALEGVSGKPEITVVNIQKFKEDKTAVALPPYATNLQRIFIVDEAHRGYDPKGSFLANLFDADRKAIKIALTGTPLLKQERESWKVFGNYLHTYYYDKSIQDGYTLRIIREEIETGYREKLNEIFDTLDVLVQKKAITKSDIFAHERFVKELLRYIIADLRKFRTVHGDDTLGGMVICQSSEQARKMVEYFDEVQDEPTLGAPKKRLRAGLILHDSDDKETRKQIVADFKKNMTVDLLIVYNMLLTGFDAPRLKRLYFGRKLKDHNLLQAITRVNRPYKDNHYGYVIDFADIKQNFDQTNEAYLRELNRFNDPDETGEGNATDTFRLLLEDKDTLVQKMRDIRQTLFEYSTDNVEEFSGQISAIDDKEKLLDLKKALIEARDTCNIVRTFGDDELKAAFARLQIEKLPQMISEVQHHIDILNQKEAFESEEEDRRVISDAMEDIEFSFRRIGSEELKLISGGVELRDKWRRAIRAFTRTRDPEDPEYISLRDAFMQRFKEYGFEPKDIAEYEEHTRYIEDVLRKLDELFRRDSSLARKYGGDWKFARLHKRLREENARRASSGRAPVISQWDDEVLQMLRAFKAGLDKSVWDNVEILNRDAFFEQAVMTLITNQLNQSPYSHTRDDRLFIRDRLTREYLGQYDDRVYS